MNALTPYIRHADGPSPTPRHAADAIQQELEAMQAIAHALASIPDDRIRVRVMAWATEVFAIGRPEEAPERADVKTVETVRAPQPALHEVATAERPESPGAESFVSEAQAESGTPPAQSAAAKSGPVPDPLTPAEFEALSIKDVETLFDDTRPPQGRFPPRRFYRRHLRPRLVLRFRLWK
jgi:hypothetical protein